MELKTNLQEAVKKKDQEKIDRALNEIERKIPVGKISELDKNFIENAKEMLVQIENPNGLFNSLKSLYNLNHIT